MYDLVKAAASCYPRAQRQTLLRGRDHRREPKARSAVTIRVMVEPLVTAVRHPGYAQRLYDALLSMTNEVRACKNPEIVQMPLLVWLSSITAGSPEDT